MSRMIVNDPTPAQTALRRISEHVIDRMSVGSQVPCPVEQASALVGLFASQSCGKCTPCRIGLPQVQSLIDRILDERGDERTLALVRSTLDGIAASADCAIGWEAAHTLLELIDGFYEDFESHAKTGRCVKKFEPLPPCVRVCPADVDVPGYLALVAAGRNDDAVRLIRHDNPLPIVCGLVCEHPCEMDCRRGMVDNPINIRGIKRFATEHSSCDFIPTKAPATGKKVAIVGGGPAGLTAAYFLTLMGHEATIFEQRKHLGGMLRYGIPAYRLPRERLQEEVDWICKQGVEVRTEVSVGTDVSFDDLRRDYDAIYLSIGAHADNKMGIPGEDAEGVISAVEMLRAIGDGTMPDYTGKRVVVVGGGNVAMDVARSAVRLGAASVDIVYRRRRADMTAQDIEVEGAIAEGCSLRQLCAPTEVVVEDGRVAGLKFQRQIIGGKRNGRFAPRAADVEPQIVPCDLVLVAVGQKIDSAAFEQAGVPTDRGRFRASADTYVEGMPGVFAGGECVTGPATAVRAIAAGKAAAANIDEYLGFAHRIVKDVDVPDPMVAPHAACARSEAPERLVEDRTDDFEIAEMLFTEQEARQEAGRCLRCDRYGIAAIVGGRLQSW